MKMITRRLIPRVVLSLGAIATCFLTGCTEQRTEYSEIKQEDAVVSQRYHESEYLQSKQGRTIVHPEINRTTFDGNIDFVVDNLEIYKRFDRTNLNAKVFYKDISEITLIGRKPRGQKFIDAWLVTNQLTRGAN